MLRYYAKICEKIYFDLTVKWFFIYLPDLLLYHKCLPNDVVVTKIALAELCLAECLFKIVPHSQIMNLLSVIVYSLHINELTPQVSDNLN